MAQYAENFQISLNYNERFIQDIESDPEYAEGVMQIIADDTYLAGREGEEWGATDFIVWHFAELLGRVEDILLSDEAIEVVYKDNPSSIIFQPLKKDIIGVRIGTSARSFNPDIPDTGLPVKRTAVVEEIIDTAEELLQKILDINPEAAEKDRIKELQEALKEAKEAYQKYQNNK